MFDFLLICSITVTIIGLVGILASSGNKLHRPNGYSPRGGWGPRPSQVYVGNAKPYEHGQKVMVSTFEEFVNGAGKVKYYNKETDRFEDVKPKRN